MKQVFIKCVFNTATLVMAIVFSVTSVNATSVVLPKPGAIIKQSPNFTPIMLQGLKIIPNEPFNFNFIVQQGDKRLEGMGLRENSEQLIRYFLAALTIPEEDLWVNLSPYEENRVITDQFAKTEMGRDVLAQDYLLKQITASMIYPESDTGRIFWDRIYQLAFEKYGTTEIPVDTFQKVWIVADKAGVYETGNMAYVVDATLKVMLEEDYIELNSSSQNLFSYQDDGNEISTSLSLDLMREIVIPELTKEVNEGTHFAPLRQIYHSLILAHWYKNKLKNSLINKIYSQQNKVSGIDQADPDDRNFIYNQYLNGYKKGVFNYIKEEFDQSTEELIPRKYFSGGWHGKVVLSRRLKGQAQAVAQPLIQEERLFIHSVRINPVNEDFSMVVSDDQALDVLTLTKEYLDNPVEEDRDDLLLMLKEVENYYFQKLNNIPTEEDNEDRFRLQQARWLYEQVKAPVINVNELMKNYDEWDEDFVKEMMKSVLRGEESEDVLQGIYFDKKLISRGRLNFGVIVPKDANNLGKRSGIIKTPDIYQGKMARTFFLPHPFLPNKTRILVYSLDENDNPQDIIASQIIDNKMSEFFRTYRTPLEEEAHMMKKEIYDQVYTKDDLQSLIGLDFVSEVNQSGDIILGTNNKRNDKILLRLGRGQGGKWARVFVRQDGDELVFQTQLLTQDNNNFFEEFIMNDQVDAHFSLRLSKEEVYFNQARQRILGVIRGDEPESNLVGLEFQTETNKNGAIYLGNLRKDNRNREIVLTVSSLFPESKVSIRVKRNHKGDVVFVPNLLEKFDSQMFLSLSKINIRMGVGFRQQALARDSTTEEFLIDAWEEGRVTWNGVLREEVIGYTTTEFLSFSEAELNSYKKDKAVVVDSTDQVGGIDLFSEFNLNVDGDGVEMIFDVEHMDKLRNIHGFTPVTITITPVLDISLLFDAVSSQS